jgi:uncharacterized membrane protein
MAGVKDAKLLGGIGSILLIFPYTDIVGFILILIALKFISDDTKKPSIFNNALYAIIMGIIGLAILSFSIFSLVGAFFTFNIFATLFSLILVVIAAVLLIIGMWFFKRSLDETGDTLNVGYFKTAGLLFFIGAILALTIIGAIVTLILFFIGAIFLIIAFFSLPEQYQPPPQVPAEPI